MSTFQDMAENKPYVHFKKRQGQNKYVIRWAIHIPKLKKVDSIAKEAEECGLLVIKINITGDSTQTAPSFQVGDMELGARVIKRFAGVKIVVFDDGTPESGSTVVNYDDADED